MLSTSHSLKSPQPIEQTTYNHAMPLRLWLLIGLLLLMVTGIFSATQGAYPIDWLAALKGQWTEQQQQIFIHIRLPRILLSILIGAGLAVSGAVLQALLRNPLADPQIIGIASGAAVAVGLCLLFGSTLLVLLTPTLLTIVMPLAAFIGGLSVCTLMMGLSQARHGFNPNQLILIGVAINAIAAAAIGFIQYLSDDQQLRSFAFWMLGSLSGAQWTEVTIIACAVLIGMLVLQKQVRGLDLIVLGESEAEYAGISTKHLKRVSVMTVAFMVGISVAFSGIIAFVGLIIPHIARKCFGASQQRLLPMSALLGGIFLLLADTLARVMIMPEELPIGILTSLMGGPFFLALLLRKRPLS